MIWQVFVSSSLYFIVRVLKVSQCLREDTSKVSDDSSILQQLLLDPSGGTAAVLPTFSEDDVSPGAILNLLCDKHHINNNPLQFHNALSYYMIVHNVTVYNYIVLCQDELQMFLMDWEEKVMYVYWLVVCSL